MLDVTIIDRLDREGLWLEIPAAKLWAMIDASARAAQPAPLTPEVTDEMVERGRSAYWGNDCTVEERVRAILTAALTEPKPRPEGAEKIADDMEGCLRDAKLEDVGLDWLADRLAALGYRRAEVGLTEKNGDTA